MELDENGLLPPGAQIGRYQILEPRGQGLTQSYLAQDPRLGRKVLIQLNALLEENDALDGALRQMANTMAHLQHPAILPVYDIGVENGLAYVVSEWTEGCLRDEMSKRDYPRLAYIMSRVSEAADYIHRRGYVHRSIDPANIRIGAGGEPRLAGFYVVATSGEAQRSYFRGATPYVAPEQMLGRNSHIGPHSDIWAIGAAIRHAITGKLPRMEVRRASDGREEAGIVSEPILPGVPSPLADICSRCLAPEPEDRYPTAAILAKDLRGVADLGAAKERVFVSHSSRDRAFVEREIVSYLDQNGVATWYSEIEIQSAAEWERSILNGLKSSPWFLIALSPNSANSEWVKDELFWAIENRVNRIIPVIIDDCNPSDLHIRLARIEQVDARSEDNWQARILDSIRRFGN